MRAGRLLRLVLILQDGRRHIAADLAEQLQVSQRTVLRDLDALSTAGVPVYATRGLNGGFQLLDTFQRTVHTHPPGLSAHAGNCAEFASGSPRARSNLHSSTANPKDGDRATSRHRHDRPDWIEGSFRFDSYETAIHEILTLGSDVEILLPVELRTTMAAIGRRITRLHRPPQPSA